MKRLWTFAGVVILLALPLAGGCGGGGTTPDPEPSPTPSPSPSCAPPTVDGTGTWEVTEIATSPDGCGGTLVYEITAVQSGSTVTIEQVPATYTATICGNEVVADTPFSYPEEGGTTTFTALKFTVTGDTLAGTSTWNWTDGTYACSGTSSFTATREGGGGNPGGWSTVQIPTPGRYPPASNDRIATALDADLRTHIVWEAWEWPDRLVSTIQYTLVDGTSYHTYVVDDRGYGRVGGVDIVLDSSGNPHVVYSTFDPDAGTGRGLYAVHYATDLDGDHMFTLETIATKDPAEPLGEGTKYDCDRGTDEPRIAMMNGAPVVGYPSESNDAAGGDTHWILARKSSAWEYWQEVNVTEDTTSGYPALDMPDRMDDGRYVAFVGTSGTVARDHAPWFNYRDASGSELTFIDGHEVCTKTRLLRGPGTTMYLFWYGLGLDRAGLPTWSRATLSTSTYSNIVKTIVGNETENWWPPAIPAVDRVTGKSYLAYRKDRSALVTELREIGAGSSAVTDIASGLNLVGTQILQIRGGYVSLVGHDALKYGDESLTLITGTLD